MPSRASKNARQQRKDEQSHNGEGEGLGTYTPDAPSLSGSPAVRPNEIDAIDVLDGGALLFEPEEPRAVRGKKHKKGKKDAGSVLDELRRNGLLGAQPQSEIAEAPGTPPDGTFPGSGEGAWPKAEGSEGARSPILASLQARAAAVARGLHAVTVVHVDAVFRVHKRIVCIVPVSAIASWLAAYCLVGQEALWVVLALRQRPRFEGASGVPQDPAPTNEGVGAEEGAAAYGGPAEMLYPAQEEHSAATEERAWQASMAEAFRGEAMGMEEAFDEDEMRMEQTMRLTAGKGWEGVAPGAGGRSTSGVDATSRGQVGGRGEFRRTGFEHEQSPQSGVARSLRDASPVHPVRQASPVQHVRRASAFERAPVQKRTTPTHHRTVSSPHERSLPSPYGQPATSSYDRQPHERSMPSRRRSTARANVPDIDTLLETSRDTIRGKGVPVRDLRSPREVDELRRETIRSAEWHDVGSRRMLVLVYGDEGKGVYDDVLEYDQEDDFVDGDRGGGLQLWDCTDLAGVRELLSIDGRALAGIGKIVYAAPLPLRPGQTEVFIAVLVNERDSSSLIVYSLVSHEIVKQVRLPGPATQFESSRDWIVVGLAAPKAELRVLSLSTLEVLGIIPGAGLHLSLSTYASASHTSISQSDVSNSTAANSPEPVFALSGRLLAYATTPPDAATASTSFASISAVTAPADISFASGLGSAASGLSQLVGRAARGETTREELTRTRDDLARAGASVAGAGTPTIATKGKEAEHQVPRQVAVLPSPGQPISRIRFNAEGIQILAARSDGTSAAVWALSPDVNLSTSEQTDGDLRETASLVYTLRRGRTNAVLDSTAWAWDGRWVALASKRRTVHVFATMPYGGPPDGYSHAEGKVRNPASLQPLGVETHPLVRLRFTRVNQGHLSPVADSMYPAGIAGHGARHDAAPLAVVFLRSNEQRKLPASLQPTNPSTNFAPSTSAGRLSVSAGRSSGSFGRFTPSTSAGRFTPSTSAGRPTSVLSSTSTGSDAPLSPRGQASAPHGNNHQDVLVFDPADGTLSLRRITTELRPRDAGGMAVSIAGTSISLSTLGALGRSPSVGAGKSGAPGISPASSASGGRDETPMVLSATEDVVATWRVRRDPEWAEVRERVVVDGAHVPQQQVVTAKDALALAELSTFPRASAMLPRSVYLTHQFTFRALGEDYHALLRQYRFTVSGPVISVRHEVVAKPGAVDGFVDGMDDIEPERASFDAPLAHAISADVGAPVQTVLPMLPNGRPRSFMSGIPSLPARTPIPIRVPSLSSRRASGGGNRASFIAVADRMGEGIRRGYSKIRAPSHGPASVDESVPLEFDEEDEDFAPRVFEDLDAESEDFEEFPEASKPATASRDGGHPRMDGPKDTDVLIPDLNSGEFALRARTTTDQTGHATLSFRSPSRPSPAARQITSSKYHSNATPAVDEGTWGSWGVEGVSTTGDTQFDDFAGVATSFDDPTFMNADKRMPGDMFSDAVPETSSRSPALGDRTTEVGGGGGDEQSAELRKKKSRKKRRIVDGIE
ncbi:hypothetical protein GGG16DRAFT_64098 [Schizophyllum commune]